MTMIRNFYRPFGINNSRVMIGGSVLGLLMLSEAAFAVHMSMM